MHICLPPSGSQLLGNKTRLMGSLVNDYNENKRVNERVVNIH